MPRPEGKPYIPEYMIRGARVRWRNFAGREERFNAAGERNFHIFLTKHDSERLTEMGLNVKTLPPKEEGDPPLDILKVKVNVKTEPQLVLVTHRGRTTLDVDAWPLLDTAPIARKVNPNTGEPELDSDGKPWERVDLVLSPYWWEVNGNEGIAVSVKKLYLTMEEDELEVEYGDIQEATSATRGFNYTPNDDEDED